jgi:hypothetical protein
MGNKVSVNKIHYEDMQNAINKKFIIINTLNKNEQSCLIENTLSASEEEEKINFFMNNNLSVNIVLYGKNNIDESVYQKYNQLINLGFINIYIYIGGLFEWLLLQDIYGDENFHTTTEELDILKYKGQSRFHLLLTN